MFIKTSFLWFMRCCNGTQELISITNSFISKLQKFGYDVQQIWMTAMEVYSISGKQKWPYIVNPSIPVQKMVCRSRRKKKMNKIFENRMIEKFKRNYWNDDSEIQIQSSFCNWKKIEIQAHQFKTILIENMTASSCPITKLELKIPQNFEAPTMIAGYRPLKKLKD